MITFDKPKNLNGKELREELRAAGIQISDLDDAVAESNGKLLLDIDTSSESVATTVVASHNGTTVAPEPTIEDKLASVGLNLVDLKTALGL